MSIIPLLACVYVMSTYLFPQLDDLQTVSVVIVASLFIALLGLFFAKSLIDPVVDMAIEAKIIASGDFNRKVAAPYEDEVGNLAQSINNMTQKIKSNMEELKSYGRRMNDVNSEIQKKMLVLSSLLQVGDIISTGSTGLDSTLEVALEKAASIFDTGYGVLYASKGEGLDFTARASCNLKNENLMNLVIKADGQGILEDAIRTKSVVIIDKASKASKELSGFKTSSNIENAVIIPLFSNKRNLGLLILGNRLEDYKFKNDDVDMVKVFAKQMSIAIETDVLSKKATELSITDDLTGLYNKRFISTRLEEEIKRAIFYQRPCSFIIFSLDDINGLRQAHGELAVEEALKKVAKSIKDNILPIGKAARISGFEFAILLPEKNKKEASHIAEEMRHRIEATNVLRDGKISMKVTIGLGENPIDGATSDELFRKAEESIREARNAAGKR
jgi:diguanylate cyclase (GGDEF)-like protein